MRQRVLPQATTFADSRTMVREHPNMMAASGEGDLGRASPTLLGIPRELRLEIFDHLRHQDYNHTLVNFSQQSWSEDNGKAQPPTNLSISWNSLLRTCRMLHAEVINHVTTESTNLQSGHHTAELELVCGTRRLHRVILRRLPCPPSQIREVRVHMNARGIRGISALGDGGFCPIVKQMFHTLRRLLQDGPLLNDNRPLAMRMPVRDLIVEYDLGDKLMQADEEKVTARRESAKPRQVFLEDGHIGGYYEVISFAKSLVNTGVLSGYLERIVVCNKFFDEEVIVVPSVTGGYSIPDYWEHAGFWWTKPDKCPI
ncbi:hypothetical protein LTR86_008196 [Recurvomyces mirabilis]|nr:hypothetical protein LTR86_008196 [Recurvomyces mirabilis]